MSFFKKFVRFCTVTSILTLALSSAVSAKTKGIVNGDNVNVRSGANKESNIITKYNNGQTLNITGKEGNFYIINADGANLYITSEFVNIVETTGTVNASNVNVREYPTTDSKILGKSDKGAEFTISARSGDWVKVDYFGAAGYVNKDFIKTEVLSEIKEVKAEIPAKEAAPVKVEIADLPVKAEEPVKTEEPVKAQESAPVVSAPTEQESNAYAVVNATSLRLRSEPTTEAQVLAVIPNGQAVDVIEENVGEWAKVSYNGNEAYVNKEFVSVGYGEKPVRTSTKGQEIVDYGKRFLGTPYVWAGNSLTSGVDCSGFVYNVFKDFGISLNRSSASMVHNGVAISKDELMVGDLVFFDTTGVNDGNISHVGIYMGNGDFIHSSSSKRTWGVTISSLYDEYYIRTYVSSSRVLN